MEENRPPAKEKTDQEEQNPLPNAALGEEEPGTEYSKPLSSDGDEKTEENGKVTYSVSSGLLNFLDRENLSFCMTSYQSGRLYLIGRNPRGGVMINEQNFQSAMGVSYEDDVLHLATGFQIHRFENILQPGERAEQYFDHCFVPRLSYTTGPLDAHELAVNGDGDLLFVNTRFNCIAKPSGRHSFEPVWMPPFISRLVDEDRCHLNGMALEDNQLAYVTAVSRSDTIDGWRDRRSDGGVVIDTRTNEVICEGLSMPHSPTVKDGRLWVLNSGTGELGWVDRDKPPKEAFVAHTFVPGFLRGLSLHGNYAFIGLSRPRYERFEGLELDEKLRQADSEAWCGVQVINLETRDVAAWFRIDGAVQEMFDVTVLPGVGCAMSLGFHSPQLARLVTFDRQE